MSRPPNEPVRGTPDPPVEMPATPTGSLSGTTLDRYAVEALIGKGGMGEVYRAVDTRLKRKVALKVIRPDKNRPDAVGRLFREARAAAALTHPNTVAIHDLGESGGLFFIVMELVHGTSLLAYVGDDRISLPRKLRWLVEIAKALACAHGAGVLHRDVKPSNVMVSDTDVAKVLDFGLAKPVEPQSFDFRTQAGRVLGTARYMSPEQLAGLEADPQSDQYAFGVTAYELLAGVYPGSPLDGPPPLDQVVEGLPTEVANVIARAMAPKRDHRFASMTAMIAALEASATPRETVVTADVPANARRSRPSIADTMRDPAAEPTETTDTLRGDTPLGEADPADDDEVPRTVQAPADPVDDAGALRAGIPASVEHRRAAHGRAHDIARTLLSRERPSSVHRVMVAKQLGSKTTRMTDPPAPIPNAARTLVSGSPGLLLPLSAAPPAAAVAPPATAAPPPTAAVAGPPLVAAPPPVAAPPSASPSPRAKARSKASRTAILLGVIATTAIVAAAAFAGTYFGARARPADFPPPAPTRAP